jgi:hypothetical protein
MKYEKCRRNLTPNRQLVNKILRRWSLTIALTLVVSCTTIEPACPGRTVIPCRTYCTCTLFGTESRTSHIPNGTANSVGSHSVSNSESGGVSVDDCATTEILVSAFDAVSGPQNQPT